MSGTARTPRRRKDAAPRRRRRFLRRGARLLFVCVLAVALVAGGFLWLRSSDLLAVEEVVAPRTKYVTADEIAEAARSTAGRNLLAVSLDEVEQRLGEIPFVAKAQVFRHYPHTLEVRLEEHAPVVRVTDSAGQTFVVAETGRVLAEGGGEQLPLITGESEYEGVLGGRLPRVLLDAVSVARHPGVAALAAEGIQVERIHVGGGGQVVLILAEGGELRLGDPERLDSKFMVAEEIIKRYSKDGRRIGYVDVGVPERAVARPAE